MGHLGTTYQHIADILSFESSRSALEKALSNPVFDWDAIVVEGSRHLVLPAIYCRLKAKNLLHCLPEELQTYLKELTAINRNRNVSILKQVHAISELLNAHQIEHVFLKGAALLAKGCYEDNAERMVGDIDILVGKTQLRNAYTLLHENGYSQTSGFNYQTIGFRHLDRLIKPSALAAIELHNELFNANFAHMITGADMLKNVITVDRVKVPHTSILAKHIILALQINDHSYYYNSFNFKTAYDSLVLRVFSQKGLLKDLSQMRYGRDFIAKVKYYFREYEYLPSIEKEKGKLLQYKVLMKYTALKWLVTGLKYSWMHLTKRIKLLVTNKYYRKYVLKRLFIFNI